MKINNVSGEYGFKALIRTGNGWKLTPEYYLSQKEVLEFNEGYSVVWPVEVQDGDIVYIPEKSELE